jgi:carbon-monoxide dehydrogenase medium subunit
MREFNFHRPKTIAEAVALLREQSGAKLLAGGQSLIPVLKLEMAQPTDLVSLGALAELRGVRVDGNKVIIGALTTHAEVAADAEVRRSIPGLARLADGIGDAQVRNRGTLGGSVAHADPAADYPAALVGLGATVKTDRRMIPADEFFTGLFSTALEPDEVVTSVHFPVPVRAAYAKFANHASRYAVVGVFVSQSPAEVRVAVTGAGPSVFRLPQMESALLADFSPAGIANIHVDPAALTSDGDASAEYRAHLVGVMARRAVAMAG